MHSFQPENLNIILVLAFAFDFFLSSTVIIPAHKTYPVNTVNNPSFSNASIKMNAPS